MTGREGFLTRMAALAQMVPNFVLGEELLEVYERALTPLGFDVINDAIDHLIMTRNSRDPFPAVKDIVAVVHPELDPEGEAITITGRIIEALSRIGPYRSEAARVFIGDVGWRQIQNEGGWESFCQLVTYDNMPTVKAQLRNAIRSKLSRNRISLVPQQSLPDREKPKELSNVSALLRKIPKESP